MDLSNLFNEDESSYSTGPKRRFGKRSRRKTLENRKDRTAAGYRFAVKTLEAARQRINNRGFRITKGAHVIKPSLKTKARRGGKKHKNYRYKTYR